MSTWPDQRALLIERMQDEARRNTSVHDRKGTQRLVAGSLSDCGIAERLLACRRASPCRLACCPICARRKAASYFRDRLSQSIAGCRPSQLRFVTVNVCETDTIEEGAADLAGVHHKRLRKIIADLRTGGLTSDLGQLSREIRAWGTREVAVRHDAGGTRYAWHWHLIVDLDGTPEDDLAQALRSQWPASKAVRIDPIRAISADAEVAGMLRPFRRRPVETAIEMPVSVRASLARITCYAGKLPFTCHQNGKAQWLPASVINDLCGWMMARSAYWTRFALVPSKGARVTKTVTTDVMSSAPIQAGFQPPIQLDPKRNHHHPNKALPNPRALVPLEFP